MKKVKKFVAPLLALALMFTSYLATSSKVDVISAENSETTEYKLDPAIPQTNPNNGVFVGSSFNESGKLLYHTVTTIVSDRLNRIEYLSSDYERDPKVYSGEMKNENFYTMISEDVGETMKVAFFDDGKYYSGKLTKADFVYRENGKFYYKYIAWLKQS